MKRISYSDLTEGKKNKILKNIQVKGISIRTAAGIWNVSAATISKIFTERYGSRERKINELQKQMIDQLNKLKQ